MENQNELRNQVKNKLGISQREASDQIPIEYVYFSKWLNNKIDVGELKLIKIKEWLNN